MAKVVANTVGAIISPGFAEPAAILMPIMVAGIRVMQEVFKARKVHMASLAS